MRLFPTIALACAVALAAAAAPAAQAPPATEKPVRTITVVINGEALPPDAQPQVVGGRLLLPLRAVLGALGISISRSGDTILARLPTGDLSLRIGSASASVNGRPLQFDAAVTDLNGTTYMPQQVLTQALGAVVTYDQRGAKVEIVSAEIGRQSGTQQSRADGGTNVQGIASAVDPNSVPPSITLVQGAVSRTINMTSEAKIYVEDVSIHSQTKGTLDDIHVGDQVLVVMTREGRVAEVHDFYKSASGTISAVSPAAIVLGSGRVVTPGKATDIELNGVAAKLGDLLVGDFVTVRSNPETGELRQIIASRNGPVPSAAASAPVSGPVPAIAQVTLSATRPLHAGESLEVTLQGTPGGRASFDIGEYVTGVDMHEDSPGIYRGRYTIPDRFNVTLIPVYGHLTVGANSAPRATAPTQLSAATTPPAITDVAPPPNQTVNNSRPSIYATFAAPTDIPINTSSVTLDVNGHDVTASTTRSNSFVTYSPGIDYPDGTVTVTVRVSDSAGNTASRSWSFTIRTKS